MLFFVDESWQTVGPQAVGALGGIAIRRANYNAFCSEVYRIKAARLGAHELTESEIKGQHAFSRAAFRRHALHADSHWLLAVDDVLTALARRGAWTFAIWTRNPALLTLRHHHTTALTEPYKQLFFDFRKLMEDAAPNAHAIINFDQRELNQDEAAACTVQNYFVRTAGGWRAHFIQVPTFTASSSSPGLQAADLVAYLGAHQADPTVRPELAPYSARVWGRRYLFEYRGRTVGTVREVF